MEAIAYALMIGSIMYAMLYTKPGMIYAVSVTSKFQTNPSKEYWNDVKYILEYLRMTKDIVQMYRDGELKVDGYIDSSPSMEK